LIIVICASGTLQALLKARDEQQRDMDLKLCPVVLPLLSTISEVSGKRKF
jgi:hypothetical protein